MHKRFSAGLISGFEMSIRRTLNVVYFSNFGHINQKLYSSAALIYFFMIFFLSLFLFFYSR